MSTPIYISRNFVEFGPFKPEEVLDFHARGILGELDHVCEKGNTDWVYIGEWVSHMTAPAPKAHAKPKPAATKKVAAKKAATKVAAKKKA
jgi:hypothetical protein